MADTKQRIRDAAISLFTRRGFAKTTIGAIEKTAGLTPRAGTFYRHFPSKEDLLIDICRLQITEQPGEFGFDEISSLGNTRAELMLIAQQYEKASIRQRPFLALIDEIRRTAVGRKLENKANNQMVDALVGWISTKPRANKLSRKQKKSLVMLVFGGWLFYLTKSQQQVQVKDLDRDQLINSWADHWSAHLDQKP